MSLYSVKRALAVVLMAFFAALTTPRASHAGFTVAAGYDLFQTDSAGTNFPGLGQLTGVPLGTFDFGGAIGDQDVCNSDTIIQRQSNVTGAANESGTTNLQVLALQLQTTGQVNYNGNGLDTYFVTLAPPPPASTGTETITFNATGTGGTFTTTLDLNLVIRKGSVDGPIVDSTSVTLTGSGTWSRTPPTNACVHPGINQNLDGADNAQDFWVNPALEQFNPNANFNLEDMDASMPEPASVTLLAVGGLGLAGAAWRRRKPAAS